MPGTFTLTVRGRGFLATNMKDVRVEAAKVADAGTIIVKRGGTITGKVVDSRGRPVARASVLVGFGGVYGGVGKYDLPSFDDHFPAILTDANGAFVLTGVDSDL